MKEKSDSLALRDLIVTNSKESSRSFWIIEL